MRARRPRGADTRVSFERLEERIALHGGDLDTTFGTGGLVTTLPGTDQSIVNLSYGLAEAVQADGKIVVAGVSGYSTTSYFLVRYNPDGSLDTTFGNQGRVTKYPNGSTPSSFSELALQSDGKIVAAGANTVMRFNSDGSLDTSFGIGGLRTLGFNTGAMTVQTDGKILVAGSIYPTNGIFIERLGTDGSLDTTFGGGGVLNYIADQYTDSVGAILVESDGTIVVGGSYGGTSTFELKHFSANGTALLGTFQNTGFSYFSSVTALVAQPDGKIVAIGNVDYNTSKIALARFDAAGTLDSTFASGGTELASIEGNAAAYAALVESDGHILITGMASTGVYATSSFFVASINSDGSADTSFGTGGAVITDVGTEISTAFAIAMQADGRILITGWVADSDDTSEQLAVVRYLNSPPKTAGLSDIVVIAGGAPNADIDLPPRFSDPMVASSSLTYTIAQNTNPSLFATASVDPTPHHLTLSYSGVGGSGDVTIRATDPGGQYVDATFHVTVYAGVPSFVEGNDQLVNENSGPQTMAGWATAITAAPGGVNPSFTFSISANSNPSLFAAGPAIDGQGNLTFTPATDVYGSATVSVYLNDNGGTAGGRSDTTLTPQTFTISVNFVNHAPSFTGGSDQSNFDNAGRQVMANWATGISNGPASESGQNVQFLVTTDAPDLFVELPNISPTGTLAYQADGAAAGIAHVFVTLKDDGGTANGGHDTSAQSSFSITIVPVNHAPSFVLLGDTGANPNSGPISFPNFATQISPGPAYEANQILTFHLTTNNNSLFAEQPHISPDGTLHFTPAANATGLALVYVTLVDNGGTANGGQDTSLSNLFRFSIGDFTRPLTSVPALHSLPSAAAKLYLNFTGDNTPTWGTHSPGVSPAYDSDGDPTTFTDTELYAIRQIWAQVADAFSPFNLDVTTVDPGNLNDMQTLRVDIGGTGSWLSTTEGGVAFVGSFYNSQPNVVFVFSKNQNNGEVKGTADTIEHEAGHGFGLEHQSIYNGTTLAQEYNPGNSVEGPIMGVPFNAAVARWWDGPSDVSSTTIQDDMAVIASATNGFGYRPDDYSNSMAGAAPLAQTGNALQGSGVIETTSDVDYFKFTSPGGYLQLNVSAEIAAGTFAAGQTGVQVLSANGQAVSLTAGLGYALSSGTYYLKVQSSGAYGDIGGYVVSGTFNQQTTTHLPDIAVYENSPHTVLTLPGNYGFTPSSNDMVSATTTGVLDGNPVLDVDNGLLTLAYLPNTTGTTEVDIIDTQ